MIRRNRVVSVDARLAPLLERHGGYQRRDMQAQPWQTLNATGGVRILNESDGPDSADSSWGGSFTVNDSSPSDKSVRYRAVITGFAEQDVRHESGSFQAQTITQSLAVISVEA
jgi:hypothetical protein